MRYLASLIAAASCLALPAAAQDFAVAQLEASPRHHEWVTVKAGKRQVRTFVAYPETQDKKLAVIVIHENRGLTDWVRSFADQLAADGFVAVAPDLLSGYDETRRTTADFASSDDARAALYELDAGRITKDLLAVRKYAAKLKAANGKTAVVGFCWGGSQAFRFATDAKGLSATLVFYGAAPEEEEQLAKITAPVFGFYGEKDERVNASLETTEALMKQNDKAFRPQIYSGAGHAFMRRGDDPEGSRENRRARKDAWTRLSRILHAYD
jgi:carboxymethylenebutenolidase